MPSLLCLLVLCSGILAVTSFLSISSCPSLPLLLMFCACSHLHSQLVFLTVFLFSPLTMFLFGVVQCKSTGLSQIWVWNLPEAWSKAAIWAASPGLSAGLRVVLMRDAVRRWVGRRSQLLLLITVMGAQLGGPVWGGFLFLAIFSLHFYPTWMVLELSLANPSIALG